MDVDCVGRGYPLTKINGSSHLPKAKSVVGLDIETGSVTATETCVNGSTEMTAGGVMPLGPGIFREGEVSDPEALGQAIKELELD